MQMVVCLSGGSMAGAHLGPVLDGLDKGVQLVRVMPRKVDMHNSAEAQALFAVIQRHSVVANYSAFLQSLYPTPAGGCRESDLVGQVSVRNPAIALERLQNALIQGVDAWHSISHI
jgi:hypothetical protein